MKRAKAGHAAREIGSLDPDPAMLPTKLGSARACVTLDSGRTGGSAPDESGPASTA
eukprot:SAG11_NODE_11214_length_776_cov_0.840473_1_plen_55_part_10